MLTAKEIEELIYADGDLGSDGREWQCDYTQEERIKFITDFAEQQIEKLKTDSVSNKEVTDCIHPLDKLRILGDNIMCLKCKGNWKRTSCLLTTL